jgi:hypothetical protein
MIYRWNDYNKFTTEMCLATGIGEETSTYHNEKKSRRGQWFTSMVKNAQFLVMRNAKSARETAVMLNLYIKLCTLTR